MLRVQILGPVRAWVDEREVDLGTPQQRAVLSVLAVRANQVLSRRELVDAIWGSNRPATAEGVVYTYITRLRRALVPDPERRANTDMLVSTRSGYLLRLKPGQRDLDMADDLRQRAQRHRTGGAAARP